jgi:hypothetical protein
MLVKRDEKSTSRKPTPLLQVIVRMNRKGLTQEEFEQLQKASREELLEILSNFVRKKRGRPRSETPLSGAERTRRWREKLGTKLTDR